MPKVDLSQIEPSSSTGYPPPYDADVRGRLYRRIGQAFALKGLGISHCQLRPGAWSSQRHWHEGIDEVLVMIEGEAVLVEQDGETLLRAGDCAVFPKDVPNGHHLVNRSQRDCSFIVIDNRRGEGDCHYPDVDLKYDAAGNRYRHKDGAPY